MGALDGTAPATDTRPKSRRAVRSDSLLNRVRLLEAAREVFAEEGPDASMNEIARRAGVGSGTLYRHFPTRIELAEAVLADRTDALQAEAGALTLLPSPVEALANWLRAVIRHSTSFRGLASWLLAQQPEQPDLTDAADAAVAARHGAMRSATSALLSRAQEAGEIRTDIDAGTLLRLVNAIAWAAEQTPDSPGPTDQMLDVVLDGLRDPDTGARRPERQPKDRSQAT